MFQMSLAAKKVVYTFEKQLHLHLIVNYIFLLSVADSTMKQSQAEETIEFEKQTEKSTIPPYTLNTLIIFLLAIAVMLVIF